MKSILMVVVLLVSTAACSQEKTRSETAWEKRQGPAARDRDKARAERRAHDEREEVARRPPATSTDEDERQRVRGKDESDRAADRRRLRARDHDHDHDEAEAHAEDRKTGRLHDKDDTVDEAERERARGTVMDQGDSESDIKTTQDIRRALMDNAELSFTAKNVRVITRDGRVTLRGAVESQRERSLVENTAKSRTGVTMVKNELEVEKGD